MGASTSVVIALFLLGFLIIGTTTYSLVDYYSNLVKNAQYEQDAMKKAEMQTDITIMNITKSASRLNITLKNSGKVTLNASSLNVFVNGALLPNYIVLSSGNVWAPKNNTNITLYPVDNTAGNRIKIITENGISDYALVP